MSQISRIYFTHPSGEEPIENVCKVGAFSNKHLDGDWTNILSVTVKAVAYGEFRYSL